MDVQLTNRLYSLGLKDDPSVTRNTRGDCLFLCFVHHCKGVDASKRKFTVSEDGKYMATYPTELTKFPHEREQVDISTTTGMRLLAADAATWMLNNDAPHPHAALLRRHIMHRFRSSCLRTLDSEALNGDVLPDNASDDDKLEHWKKLMRCNGEITGMQQFYERRL